MIWRFLNRNAGAPSVKWALDSEQTSIMTRLLRFGIAGLIGTAFVFAESSSSSKQQSKESSVAPQSRSRSSSSQGDERPSISPVGATQIVLKVCSKKNPPPCAKPPRAVFTPEPEYSDEARKANYRGFCTLKVVVGTDGSVSSIRVIGHAGMGLDENAVEALKKVEVRSCHAQWQTSPGRSHRRRRLSSLMPRRFSWCDASGHSECNDSINNVGSHRPSKLWRRKPTKGSEERSRTC